MIATHIFQKTIGQPSANWLALNIAPVGRYTFIQHGTTQAVQKNKSLWECVVWANRLMPMENSSDETLVRAIADQASTNLALAEVALRELYARHGRAVYSLAQRILNNPSDSEEIVQDVFLRLWSQASTYTPERGAVSTWIMTIARHGAIDAYRRNRIRTTMPIEQEQLEAVPATQPRNVLNRMALDKALSGLVNEERSLLEAIYFEGLSHSQLANRTGMPLGSIKTKIRNALQRLRAPLNEDTSP